MKSSSLATNKAIIITYALVAVAFAALFTRFQFAGFPDVALALFAALSLSCGYTFCLVLGVVLGLISEGLAPEVVWVMPVLYVLLASASFYASREMNMRRWPLLSYLVIWALVFKLLPPLAHGYALDWVDVGLGGLITGVLAFLLHLPLSDHG